MGFGSKALVVLLAILTGPSAALGGEVINVLAMGQVDPSYSPISDFLKAEPSLDETLVVSRSIHAGIYSTEQLPRFIRIYMPRTFDALLSHDFFVSDQPREEPSGISTDDRTARATKMFPDRPLAETPA